jgi:hypothetical protein
VYGDRDVQHTLRRLSETIDLKDALSLMSGVGMPDPPPVRFVLCCDVLCCAGLLLPLVLASWMCWPSAPALLLRCLCWLCPLRPSVFVDSKNNTNIPFWHGLLQSLSEFFSRQGSSKGGSSSGGGLGGVRGGLEAQVESMKTRAVVRDMAAYMRRVNPRLAAAMIGAVGPGPVSCRPASQPASRPFLNVFELCLFLTTLFFLHSCR